MTDISIRKTGEDSASKSLQVTVPPERVRQAEVKALRYYQKRARLPGFRPGKAPDEVVRKRFGDAIRQTMLEELIRESWETAKTNEDLKPITEPHIHNLKFESGGPVEFEFHVEVKPDIRIDRTGGFTLRRSIPKVAPTDVEERLHRLREQKAAWLPVEGEKPAVGQMVRVAVAPIENGEAGTVQPYAMILGEGNAIPDLEERIMGLLPGETVDAEVRFPEDHPDASRRGQTRHVRITLHEVKRQELPALDDGFAREVGDFEDLAALRTTIQADLGREAEREADAQVRQELLRQLVEANSVAAPHSLVERFLHGYAQAYRIEDAQFAGFAEELRPLAEAQVRRDLILDALVEREGLRATAAELDARVAALAEARRLPATQVYASLEKGNRLRELERAITEEKAFAWLLPQSTVEEVTG